MSTSNPAHVPVRGAGTLDDLPPVPWHLVDGVLAERLASKVGRLGYLGGFFAHLAHAPEPLAAFEAFTTAARGALAEPIAEVIALTVACQAGNRYELGQHERLALTHGHAPDWIRRVETAPGTLDDPVERAAAELAAALWHRRTDAARRAVTDLVRLAGEPVAAAALLLGGRFVAHAVLSAVLGLEAPVDSPLADAEEARA
ncbi:MAG TPA: hypothetical protein VIL36_10260 [Acidimicrobiales bacterium]